VNLKMEYFMASEKLNTQMEESMKENGKKE
jgi:hypothetical protein